MKGDRLKFFIFETQRFTVTTKKELEEYIKFLKKKNLSPELISFLDRNLLPSLLFEQRFFNQLYKQSEILELLKEEVSSFSLKDLKKLVPKLPPEFYTESNVSLAKNLFLLVLEAYKNAKLELKKENREIIKEWIEDARKDLERAKDSHKNNDIGEYLFHLEQSVEKSVKALGMLYGLYSESELQKELGHKISRIYSLLLEPILTFVDNQFDHTFLFIEKESLKKANNILENPSKHLSFDELRELDGSLLNIRQCNQEIKKLVRHIKNKTIETYMTNVITFVLSILFLSVLTPTLYNIRYPDVRRKLRNYYELKIVRSTEIFSDVEDFINTIERILNGEALRYFPLEEAVKKHLKSIRGLNSKKKLETIESVLNKIQSDTKIQKLLEKMKAHPEFTAFERLHRAKKV